jgi:hypothetical protein
MQREVVVVSWAQYFLLFNDESGTFSLEKLGQVWNLLDVKFSGLPSNRQKTSPKIQRRHCSVYLTINNLCPFHPPPNQKIGIIQKSGNFSCYKPFLTYSVHTYMLWCTECVQATLCTTKTCNFGHNFLNKK